jgi:hypothetical protein
MGSRMAAGAAATAVGRGTRATPTPVIRVTTGVLPSARSTSREETPLPHCGGFFRAVATVRPWAPWPPAGVTTFEVKWPHPPGLRPDRPNQSGHDHRLEWPRGQGRGGGETLQRGHWPSHAPGHTAAAVWPSCPIPAFWPPGAERLGASVRDERSGCPCLCVDTFTHLPVYLSIWRVQVRMVSTGETAAPLRTVATVRRPPSGRASMATLQWPHLAVAWLTSGCDRGRPVATWPACPRGPGSGMTAPEWPRGRSIELRREPGQG